MTAGRPEKYKPEYVKEAFKLCLLGATDNQLASFFEVSVSAIKNWKSKHPEFLASLTKGKIEADIVIAKSLYHRAKGYSCPEDKVFLHEGQPVIVPTTKYYAPDTTACIFWLKNRDKENWRDVKQINSSIKQEILIESREDLEKMLKELDKEIEK